MSVQVASPIGRIRSALSWSMLGSVVLRVVNVMVSVLMARLIAPDEYGVFAVALTVWTVLGTLAEFGLGSDLVRSPDVDRRAPTVATLGLLTSGTLAVGMFVGAAPIAVAFESPGSEGVIRIMAASTAIFGLSIVPAALLQRSYRQRALFVVNGAGLVTGAAAMLVLASSGVGPASLAWGQVLTQVVVVVGLFVATRSTPRLGYDARIFRESMAFCLPLALANLLSWVLLSVDNLIVARSLGPVSLGLYALAFNVSSWPMTVVGQAVRVIALPAFSQVEGRASRNLALVRSMAPVAAVGAFLGLSLATLAGPVIQVMYGDRWAGAATALTGLAVFGGIRVVLDVITTFLIAVGMTTHVLVVQVVWLLAMVPVMVGGVNAFGLAGAGWSHVVVAVGLVVPAYLWCLRRADVDVASLVRQWVVPVAASVPAAAASWWVVATLDVAPALKIVLGGSLALTTYLLLVGRWGWQRLAMLRRSVAAVPETV